MNRNFTLVLFLFLSVIRSAATAGPLPHHPNVLSPATTGPLLEDVWPTLFFGEETITEIRRKTRKLPWAQSAFERMRQEADEVIAQAPQLPVEKIGWRHDFYSHATAEHLQYDSASPERFLDPLTGQFEQGAAQHAAWVLLTHERTYRLMRGVGVLYRLTGDERYARWVAAGMRAAAGYFTHTEFHHPDVGGPALYYQNLYDAAVLIQLTNAYSLTRMSPAYTADDHAAIRKQIFEERMPSMAGFLRVRPTHNMSCFVSLALACAGAIFERPDWQSLAFGEKSGLRRQLLNGIPSSEDGQVDGFWYEGTTFYHLYSVCPLIGLWEADRARHGSPGNDPELRRRFEAMFIAPVNMVDHQLRLPLVGDLGAPRVMNLAAYRHLYEYAAGQLDATRFGPVLSAIYEASHLPRNGLSALAYGPDDLPSPGGISASHTVLPVAGLGVFRPAGPEQIYVTFRCGKYVGAHDHPDRLTVALNAFGQPIAPDLGEPGYSLRDRKTNLSYYRTTLAHNTIFADEAEQLGAASLEWHAGAIPPRASGVITQAGIRFSRTVIVDAPYVILLDDYQADAPHRYGWVFHAYGPVVVQPQAAAAELKLPPFPESLGFASLKERRTGACDGPLLARWRVTPQVELSATIVSDGLFEFTGGTTPGQPYPDTQGALVLRAPGANRRFVTVLEPLSGTPATVSRVALEGKQIVLKRTDHSLRRYPWDD